MGGVALLGRGVGMWRRIPGAMALGLVPAALVAVVLLAGLVTLAWHLPGLANWITPFADNWPEFWAGAVRVAAGTALLGAALVVIAVSFTALTLLIGEPFYDRIWRATERELGGPPPEADYGFWRSVGDGISLVARGVGIAIAAGLVGLVPLVGGFVGAVAGVLMTGWLLADELSSRALTARGIGGAERRALLRAHRARAWGFGVATQLCFFVPLGAVLIMPAAVAGSTVLARSLAADRTATVSPGPGLAAEGEPGSRASD